MWGLSKQTDIAYNKQGIIDMITIHCGAELLKSIDKYVSESSIRSEYNCLFIIWYESKYDIEFWVLTKILIWRETSTNHFSVKLRSLLFTI